MRLKVPRGALLETPSAATLEIAFARLEDRVRDVEIAVRSRELDARDLRDLRRQLAQVRADTADAALLASLFRKLGRHVTQGGDRRLR